MGFLDKLFRRKKKEDKTGGLEDFMSLIRVYFQSTLAAKLGITNLGVFPDLATFKRTLHVQTVNNKLGVGEKKVCAKMLQDIYGLQESFFEEIEQSIKKGCKTQNDVRNYLFLFQGFSQDIIMLMGNLLKWKFRIPSFLKNALKQVTAKSVHDIFSKDVWSDEATRTAVYSVRSYQQRLGFSEQWITDYVFNVMLLAKKEPRPSQEEVEKAESKMKNK